MPTRMTRRDTHGVSRQSGGKKHRLSSRRFLPRRAWKSHFPRRQVRNVRASAFESTRRTAGMAQTFLCFPSKTCGFVPRVFTASGSLGGSRGFDPQFSGPLGGSSGFDPQFRESMGFDPQLRTVVGFRPATAMGFDPQHEDGFRPTARRVYGFRPTAPESTGFDPRRRWVSTHARKEGFLGPTYPEGPVTYLPPPWAAPKGELRCPEVPHRCPKGGSGTYDRLV